jgi:ketosteroid isomerase-like protein
MTDPFQAQVLAAEARLREAMRHNDVAVLDELIAPELLFTTHWGQLATKADDLAAHRARLLRLTALEPSQEQWQFHADFAIVSVLMHLVGTYAGAPIDQNLRYTRVWALAPDGAVRLVAGHMSEIPPG